MKATIAYNEISDFVERKYKVCPLFEAVDGRSVEVSYKPNRILPAIKVKLHVEGVRRDIVCLSYDCGMAISYIIAGVLTYLKEALPDAIEVNTDEKRVNIYLQRFKEFEKVWKIVALSDIKFDADAASVVLELL